MLKAKRIVKVMLCICIAFSMIISVYADNIIIEVNDIVGELNQTAAANNVGIYIKYPTVCNLYKDTKYKITISVPNVTVNNYNRKTVVYKSGSILGVYASLEFKITENNIEILTELNVNIERYEYNNNILNVVFTCNRDIIATSSNAVNIYYYSYDKGQKFIIDEPIKPYVIITEIKESKTQLLINNIKETINNIIIMNNNIISFVTNKPWVILLGITVSLLSFLIYKVKSII